MQRYQRQSDQLACVIFYLLPFLRDYVLLHAEPSG
jgi:hypothetical protein